jgi:hypothetical protein
MVKKVGAKDGSHPLGRRSTHVRDWFLPLYASTHHKDGVTLLFEGVQVGCQVEV